MQHPPSADTARVSVYLPRPGQLVRVVTGEANLVAVVDAIDRGSVVLDVHGAALPAGVARLSFNSQLRRRAARRPSRRRRSRHALLARHRRRALRPAARDVPRHGRPARRDRAAEEPTASCETLNLSIGGVLLETDQPFAADDRLTVTIRCTESHAVTVPSTVVRSEHGARRLALTFTDVGGKDERTLSLLVGRRAAARAGRPVAALSARRARARARSAGRSRRAAARRLATSSRRYVDRRGRDPLAGQQRRDARRVAGDRLARHAPDGVLDRDVLGLAEERLARRDRHLVAQRGRRPDDRRDRALRRDALDDLLEVAREAQQRLGGARRGRRGRRSSPAWRARGSTS